MNYYRKYRPQTVGNLDLVSVREAFERILNSGNISHAYLFSGPRGTGKTSSARILAKILHCEKNQELIAPLRQGFEGRTAIKPLKLSEPCNECVSCKAIMGGSHLGVVEMDAASNRGIEDIRALREKIGLAPAQGPYTVYVIDEVHMLTTEAFNALLKTLEEPPAHAVFILATTEIQKVPETIISRCTQIFFNRANIPEICGSLAKAVTGENLLPEEGVLELIAQSVDGSFRDAMKILEQAAESDKKISLETTRQLTGMSRLYDPAVLLSALREKKVKPALAEIELKQQQGADMVLYGTRIVQNLRELLLQAVVNKGDSQSETGELLYLTELMTKAVIEMKYTPIVQLPLEMAVAEWCLAAPIKIAKEKQEASVAAPTVANPEAKLIKEKIRTEAGVTKIQSNKEFDLEEVKAHWGEVLQAVKPLNHSLEALLKAAHPVEVKGNWITVEVFYTFHREQLEQERYRVMLEKQCGGVMGAPVKLKFILGKKATQAVMTAPLELKNVTGEVADEELAKAAEEIFGK